MQVVQMFYTLEDSKTGVLNLQGCKIIYKPVKNKIKYIKYELLNNRPVLIELKVTKFYNVQYTTIYGYRSSVDCFICMHTKGKSWGDKGYFYLPYKHVKKYAKNLFAITDIN